MSQKKLTPDIVGKVIRADLKNIIDKVGSGRPLSGVERNIFETLNLTGEDLSKKRQLALLSKWSNGKRLNVNELSEIESLLPEGSIKEEVSISTVRTLRRTGYYELYSYYAEKYGASDRTIKRWVKDGKNVKPEPDFCPLDDPDQLRSWWVRNMEKPCPAEILLASVEERKNAPAAEAKPQVEEVTETLELEKVVTESEADEKPKGPEFTPRELKPVGDDEVGLNATLTRLRNIEVQVSRIYLESLEAGDEGKASVALGQWTKITTQVRQVEKDAIAQAESLKQLIPRQYAETRLVEYHTSIAKGTRGLYRRMCEVMRIPINAETEAAWNSECDVLFISFREEVFK